ncbi:MAG: hypothetical protein ABR555_00340 [Pyrinomonadaceae bacterium]
MSRTEDSGTLQDLGRASIQIVHDLKNQLNGLKLYATFLRKRLEKNELLTDEQETVSKLISGLDRAADDLSTIVQYGRPIELKMQAGFDLQKLIRGVCANLKDLNCHIVLDQDSEAMQGEFDPLKITDALRWICLAAAKWRQNADAPQEIRMIVQTDEAHGRSVTIEWSGLKKFDHDPIHSFVGSDEIRLSLAAKILTTHGGSIEQGKDSLLVTLPLSRN